GPVGISLRASLVFILLSGIQRTKRLLLSLHQVNGWPRLAFIILVCINCAVALATSNTQSSNPLVLVWVKAIFFSSGDQVRKASLGFNGNPFTCCSVLSAIRRTFMLFI